MTDPIALCQNFLNEMNRQQGFMDGTQTILEGLRDRLGQEYSTMDEECGELEDAYDDWVDVTATIIGNLWVPGLIEDLIEITQCTSALGNWENTSHQISVFEERLENERQARDAARDQWLECLHDAMALHR